MSWAHRNGLATASHLRADDGGEGPEGPAYDARHACLTYLASNGVPDMIVSAWAGHADLSLAKWVYVRPSAKNLERGCDALAVLLGCRARYNCTVRSRVPEQQSRPRSPK